MTSALFLDRDGVINIDHGYVHRMDQIVWVEDIFDLARTAHGLGLKLIIVTNQAGIARGYYTEEDFSVLMHWMRGVFERAGAPLTDVYYCPYHPEGIGAYKKTSDHRKPAPGMLLDAARDHHIDLSRSFLIGDQLTDIAAGRAAGLPDAHLGLLSHAGHPENETITRLHSHKHAIDWLTARLR